MTTLYELSVLGSPKWWVDKIAAIGLRNFAQKESICQTDTICNEITCSNCSWAVFMRENRDVFLENKTLRSLLPKFIKFLEQKESKEIRALLDKAVERFHQDFDWPKLPNGKYDFFLTHKMLGCDNCIHANTEKIYKGGCCIVEGRPFEMRHDIDANTAKCKRQMRIRFEEQFASKLKRKAFVLSKIAMAVLAIGEEKVNKKAPKKSELHDVFWTDTGQIRW